MKAKIYLKNNLSQSFPELEGRLYNDEAYVFQNDNAISHKAPIVQRWKANRAIRS